MRPPVSSRALRTTMSSSSSSAAIAMEAQTSTCTWTILDDANQCVLRPRSCSSCLNVKPTSGEVCTLTPSGVCMGPDAYDPQQDYTRMGASSAWPPHLNYFSAANATYCAADDVACASCRDKSFQNWKTNPSQYCTGARGCVCVSICENAQWEAHIQDALNATLSMEHTNGSLLNCTVEPVASDDDLVSASGTLTDFVGLAPQKALFASADECMWYQNQTLCGAPRSCYDCLNTPLYSGNKCMLHSSGYCTSMAAYDRSKDYRRAGRLNHSVLLFPSNDTRYCEANDAICRECRAGNFTSWQNVSSPPVFCAGRNGCVCVASCESTLWKTAIVNLTCDTSALASLNLDPLSRLSTMAILLTSLLALLGSAVCALMLLTGYRRYHRRRHSTTALQRARPRSPKVPLLELSGWKAMREKLIESEREFVGNSEEDADAPTPSVTAPPSERRLQRSSDESISAETHPEGPALVVEQGDAYRPLSPSRMHA